VRRRSSFQSTLAVPGTLRWPLASAATTLASTAKPSPLTSPRPCSAAAPHRITIGRRRCRGSGRDGSWRRSSAPAPDARGPGGRTSGTPGSSAPPRTAAAPIGCRSSSRRSASGSSARDRSRDARCGCNTARGAAAVAQIKDAVDASKQMVSRNVGLETEGVEQLLLCRPLLSHHRGVTPSLVVLCLQTRPSNGGSPSSSTQ